MLLAICDDDNDQLIDLKNKCESSLHSLKISPIVIHKYRSGEDLIFTLNAKPQNKYDLYIMDIEFGPDKINGIDTTKKLREIGITAPIIISTSYDTYLRQGYGLGIMRYINKPVTQDEMTEALTACIKTINNNEGKEIIVKNGTENVVVRYKDIMYFECNDHTIIIYTNDQKKYSCYKTIGYIEQQILPYFFQIHKSIIANFNYVSCINGLDLALVNGTILPIAQRRRSQCMDFLKNLIREQM